MFHTIFSISSLEALIFFEFEYQIFEYFKDFKFLLENFYAFISLLQKTFWRLNQIKENV